MSAPSAEWNVGRSKFLQTTGAFQFVCAFMLGGWGWWWSYRWEAKPVATVRDCASTLRGWPALPPEPQPHRKYSTSCNFSWFLWITYFILIFSIIEWLRWSFASKLTNKKSSDSCRPQKVSGASQHNGRRRPVLKCKQQTSWNKMARHSSSGVIQLWSSDMKNVCEGTLS